MDSQLLAARPSNSADISFARHCFRATGTREVWLVKAPLLAAGSSWDRYYTEEQAKREARGREVVKSTETINERVSWK